MKTTRELEEAVWQFEQCFSLESFKALQESSSEKDEYAQGVKVTNNRVCSIYADAGNEGLDYIEQQLSSNPNVDFRERATVILGEVARTHPEFREEALRILRLRSVTETERCIQGRIAYAIQELK